PSRSALEQRAIAFWDVLVSRWIQEPGRVVFRDLTYGLSRMDSLLKNPGYANARYEQLGPEYVLTVGKNGELSTFCPELATGSILEADKFCLSRIHEIDTVDDLLENPKYL